MMIRSTPPFCSSHVLLFAQIHLAARCRRLVATTFHIQDRSDELPWPICMEPMSAKPFEQAKNELIHAYRSEFEHDGFQPVSKRSLVVSSTNLDNNRVTAPRLISSRHMLDDGHYLLLACLPVCPPAACSSASCPICWRCSIRCHLQRIRNTSSWQRHLAVDWPGDCPAEQMLWNRQFVSPSVAPVVLGFQGHVGR